MNKKILIIEDDPGIQLSLKDEFESEGFEVFGASDGLIGLDMIKLNPPDLIILDLMLPYLNGFEICKKLRQDGNNVPIIMLTVKDNEVDKVLGLELGADDYVTKPFSLRELLARVNALLRRTGGNTENSSVFCIGDTVFDFKKYEAVNQGILIDYTPLEFQMLKFLYENKGRVVTRDDFLLQVWGENNTVVTERTIDSHIANIRKKLEDNPSDPVYIISVRGVGYKLVI
ncbi:MAG: response regulator transcription factor [Bacteroidales bacterium]|nr:response regulator transcription factor [Bacteroidales bacterium]